MSEMFFLHDLKRQCGSFLANFVDVDNVVDLLQTARLYSIPRLEHSCVEFMASVIEEVWISSSPHILSLFQVSSFFRWSTMKSSNNW